jgi:putative Mg2+ transporter-C (MgtC) family protein
LDNSVNYPITKFPDYQIQVLQLSSSQVVIRLLLAAGLGAAIGLEREIGRKPAGLRTNMLISIGSALFTIVSLSLAHDGGTIDRIAAQIVTGVGFLGGGAILRDRSGIHGMTTAATIWVNAAIGMAAGSGALLVATMATGLTLAVLALLPSVERLFKTENRDRDNLS